MSMYEVVACNDCGEQTTRGNQPCRLCRSFEELCSPSPKPAEPVQQAPAALPVVVALSPRDVRLAACFFAAGFASSDEVRCGGRSPQDPEEHLADLVQDFRYSQEQYLKGKDITEGLRIEAALCGPDSPPAPPGAPSEPKSRADTIKPYRQRMAQIYDTTKRAMDALKTAADEEVRELREAYADLLTAKACGAAMSKPETCASPGWQAEPHPTDVPVPPGLASMFGEDHARETVRSFAEKRRQHGHKEGIEAAARVLERMGSPEFAAAVRELIVPAHVSPSAGQRTSDLNPGRPE